MTVQAPEERAEELFFASYSPKKSRQRALIADRSSFIPKIDSPGPAAYVPSNTATHHAAPRPGFGSGTRDQAGACYISELHNKSLPARGNPGPGTYRIAKSEKHVNNPNHPFTPSWRFGTAQQREETKASTAPGPIYNTEQPTEAPRYSFAPQGNLELGQQRSRADTSKVFVSNAHSCADPTTRADLNPFVGPGQYDSGPSGDTIRRTAPRAVFGKSTRDVKDSLSKEHLAADPMACTAAHTPGAIYDLPAAKSTNAPKMTSGGARMYSPELGSSHAGPYLSRGHEAAMLGAEGPGPGAYDVVASSAGVLASAPKYGFGSASQSSGGALMPGVVGANAVPGPGAYNIKSNSGGGFSIASCIRSDPAGAARLAGVPGPGTYELEASNKADGSKHSAPIYSMGTKQASISPPCTPGPATYPNPSGMDIGPGKGFSFGGKERTKHEKSMVGVRYHGPLAAQERLGTEGPGPVYDTRSSINLDSTKKTLPSQKMGTASRDVGSALGTGGSTPGPGSYDVTHIELSEATSRYARPPGAVFSSSERFKSNYSTF